MWGAIITAGDRFLSDFTIEKKAVIQSKWLRVPQLLILILLLIVVVGYNVGAKLEFLVLSSIGSYARISFKESFTDYWGCNSAIGNCKMSLPKKYTLDVCSKTQWMSIWNGEKEQREVVKRGVSCIYFDPRIHLQQSPGNVMLATAEVTKRQKLDDEGIWQGVDQQEMTSFVIGSLGQLVRIEGSVGGVSLDRLPGFLRAKNKAAPQRIFCAKKGLWHPCDIENSEFFDRQYGSDPPDWSPTMNSTMLGCANGGSGILCPATALLQAAGVDMNEVQKSADGKPLPSQRFKGKSIGLHIEITNADPADYWAGGLLRLGPKKKLIITPSVQELGTNPLFVAYRDEPLNTTGTIHGHGKQRIQKVEMFGIHLVLSHSVHWKEFHQAYFVSLLALIGVMLRFADMIVIQGLVRLYRIFGCGHISVLFQYNAVSRSVDDHRMLECTTAEDIQKAHEEAEMRHFDADLKELNSRKAALRAGMTGSSSRSALGR
mmetsp:Transcript_62043/g.192296  ORF Transcript_62043/g.192296 Transcript_62043/m.192296 type:complete len:487 (-) Transcript_62043:311-1771(-)